MNDPPQTPHLISPDSRHLFDVRQVPTIRSGALSIAAIDFHNASSTIRRPSTSWPFHSFSGLRQDTPLRIDGSRTKRWRLKTMRHDRDEAYRNRGGFRYRLAQGGSSLFATMPPSGLRGRLACRPTGDGMCRGRDTRALSSRSAMTILLAGMFYALTTGLVFALGMYFHTYSGR